MFNDKFMEDWDDMVIPGFDFCDDCGEPLSDDDMIAIPTGVNTQHGMNYSEEIIGYQCRECGFKYEDY